MQACTYTGKKSTRARLQTRASAIRQRLLHVDSVLRQIPSFHTPATLWVLRCSPVLSPANINYGGRNPTAYLGNRLIILSSTSIGNSFAKRITNISMKRTYDGKNARKKG